MMQVFEELHFITRSVGSPESPPWQPAGSAVYDASLE